MASTYTTALRFNKQGVGDNVGLWGGVVNTQFDLIDDAIAGHANITLVAGNNVLSSAAGTADEARNAVIVLGGTLASPASVICPDSEKIYAVRNNTTGGQTVTFKNASGSGLVVPLGYTLVVCDGTSVRQLTPTMLNNSLQLSGTSVASWTAGALSVGVSITSPQGTITQLTGTSASFTNLNVATSAQVQSLHGTSISANTINVNTKISALDIIANTINVSAHVSANSFRGNSVSVSGGSFTNLRATTVSVSSIVVNGAPLVPNPYFAWGRVASDGSLLSGDNVTISSVATGYRRVTFTSAPVTNSYAIVFGANELGATFPVQLNAVSVSTANFLVEVRSSALANYGFSFFVIR